MAPLTDFNYFNNSFQSISSYEMEKLFAVLKNFNIAKRNFFLTDMNDFRDCRMDEIDKLVVK